MQRNYIFVAFLGKNLWIITKTNFSAQKKIGVAMPGQKSGEFDVFEEFLGAMTPQLVPSDVSGLNMKDKYERYAYIISAKKQTGVTIPGRART
jgi:hypothetical protein